MKRKNKHKSKGASKSKQLKKELANKLSVAFNEIVTEFGKAKKADKVIEKFTKQLIKKVTFSNYEEPLTITTSEESSETTPKEAGKKTAVKKSKAPVKEAVAE